MFVVLNKSYFRLKIGADLKETGFIFNYFTLLLVGVACCGITASVIFCLFVIFCYLCVC